MTYTHALVRRDGSIYRCYGSEYAAETARGSFEGGQFLAVVDLRIDRRTVLQLRAEARAHGDDLMATLCTQALDGRRNAIVAVVRAVENGRG